MHADQIGKSFFVSVAVLTLYHTIRQTIIIKILCIIVKFLQDKRKYRKRRAKIIANISARLFRVMCNKVSGIPIHKD